MQIMKIDPDEKYVLVFPRIKHQSMMEELADSLNKFLAGEEDNLAFIYGKGIAIVPASQIVGYRVIGEDD